MEPEAGPQRPDPPLPATTGSVRGPWLAARLAVVALALFAVLDVFRTVVAVGHYEERILVVTHGSPDLLPPWLVYVILDELLPRGVAVTTVVDRSWLVVSLVAAAAFVTWLHRARREAGRLGGALAWGPAWAVGGWLVPVANLVIPYLVVRDVQRASGPPRPDLAGRWWASVLAVVLLVLLAQWYGVLTSHGSALHRTPLDTRTVAYPLWAAGAVMTVIAAVLSARVVRRITRAQQRTGAVGVERSHGG